MKTNNNNKNKTTRENEHRERERVTDESSRFFLAMMMTTGYEFMARGVRARELLITTGLLSLVALSQKEKNAQISLSLSCVFFFLPSLANNNTLEKENARKSDRLL